MQDYCALNKKELMAALSSSEKGLSKKEAEKRLEEAGPNEIVAKDKKGGFSILLSQFKSPLILILIIAAVIAGFLGEITDASIILGIVLLNSLLGFYQEFKSEKALLKLKRYITFKAKVLRNGKEIEINTKELVVGDIVFLNNGDIVPADIRLLEAQELNVNESVLTGESNLVYKNFKELKEKNLSINQKTNLVFMGTSVAGGCGKGIVIAIGTETEFGRTATVLSAKEPPTDFQKNIKKFGDFLIKIILILTLCVFFINAVLGKGVVDSFLFALALAVGITPELLPIIITITLSRGAIKLAKKKVIVKKLASIEDLGNIDVLCTDKTGTLTENKITLYDYLDIQGTKKEEIIENAIICNTALTGKDVTGKAADVAILEYCKKNNIRIKNFERIEEIEFDHERRRMSIVYKKGNKFYLATKGAPESILEVCNKVKKGGKILPIGHYKKELIKKFEDFSREGYNVIAIAYKEIKKKKEYETKDENSLVFLGFLIFLDPPKKDAENSLIHFQKLGVEIKILTGDNSLVTEQICNQVGIKIKNKIVLGSELNGLNEKELSSIIRKSNIFARITPEQKYKIVEILSKQGHIVGFLGDGVNDAPALKAADVGITVDSAIDIAKENADVILLNKSLDVIANGIREGRKTFGNITKYIFNTISANFGNMFTLAFSSLFLKFIPLRPSQILLNNFISDGPLMTISTDHVDEEGLKKPKRWDIKLISRFMISFGLISSIFDVITILTLSLITEGNIPLLQTAWFLESVMTEIFITFAIRTKKRFWKSRPSSLLIVSSIAAILLTLVLIYSPLSSLFKFEKLPINILMLIGGIILMYFLSVELYKKHFYRKHEN